MTSENYYHLGQIATVVYLSLSSFTRNMLVTVKKGQDLGLQSTTNHHMFQLQDVNRDDEGARAFVKRIWTKRHWGLLAGAEFRDSLPQHLQ